MCFSRLVPCFHVPSLIINSVARALGDDHAWETFLASDSIRHIHRRSPRRFCCTSPQATLRDLALYVSCGTLFHSFATKRSVTFYLLLTTCSAGATVRRVSLPGPTGVHSDAQAGWHWRRSANPHLLHCCCTAEQVLTRATNKRRKTRKKEGKKEKRKQTKQTKEEKKKKGKKGKNGETEKKEKSEKRQ